MHTFHLLSGECTITLEDLQLQLELPVDRPVMIRSIVATDWSDVCEQLLRRALDTIYGAQINMNLLKINFVGLDMESSEVEKEQHARAYILRIIGGLLMPNKLRNLVHLRWLLKLVDFREQWLDAPTAIMGVVPTAILRPRADYLYTFSPQQDEDNVYIDYDFSTDEKSIVYVIGVWDTIYLYAYTDSVTNTHDIIVPLRWTNYQPALQPSLQPLVRRMDKT
ncbi:hypothetical protein PVK06_004510 [Gossypium arboreum]|uniref:Aminotransferase-like plant mobile domain-containing protein n=1 Tax=Gossypium arboreum TaxID=29729 RepID=A0ABR0QSG8_GOSAR|nr:hypothetical protein PVK06_004510 [Gossypium arboreum]